MKVIAKQLAKQIVTTAGIPLVLMLSLTMCSESNLDLQPLGSLTDQTFYQTAKDFDAATLGPYSTMLNYTYEQSGGPWWTGIQLPDDDNTSRDTNNGNDTFNWTSGNGDFGNIWETSYRGIGRANVVIDELPQAKGLTDAQKPRYEAEAKFMRAWFYFVLARNWGNVPIVTKVPTTVAETQVPSSKPGEVWDLMEADLDFAAKNLPADYGSEKGRATKYTASALLGKVQLFRAQWFNLPAKYASAVTNLQAAMTGPYQLTANYGDNFDQSKENNSESLFELQATQGDNINSWGTSDTGGRAGHAYTIIVSPSCSPIPPNKCAPGANGEGYGIMDIDPSLTKEFEANDPRKYWTEYSQGEDYGGVPYDSLWTRFGHSAAKYNRPWQPNRFPNNWSEDNLRFIRLSDVMLMLAEAEALSNNDVASAAALVNKVRARARGTPYEVPGVSAKGVPDQHAPAGTLPDVPATGSGVSFVKNYIMHERRVELALEESHRWDDIVRWMKAGFITANDITFGHAASNTNFRAAGQGPSNKYLLKPVPQSQLDLNKLLVQNPGY